MFNRKLTREESSKECFDKLNDNGLIKPSYTSWEMKSEGSLQGFILFGKSKKGLPKKTYVKSLKYCWNGSLNYPDNPLFDYAAFTLMKKCGLSSPKVKIKSLADESFLFSTDAAIKKKQDDKKKYHYFDMTLLPYQINVENKMLEPRISSIPAPTKAAIAIDIQSLIRMVILSNILGLCDLIEDNVGMIISENIDNGHLKAKMTCIDMATVPDETSTHYQNLRELIYARLKCSLSSYKWLRDLIDTVEEPEYLQAFSKIETYFLSTCDELKQKIEDMPFQSEASKVEAYERIDLWRRNYSITSDLAHSRRGPGLQG